MIIQNTETELSESERIDHPITISEELLSTLALPLVKDGIVQGTIMGGFRTPNKVTLDLYNEFLEYLNPTFCGYETRSSTYTEALREAKSTEPETVPIYELMSYHILRAQEEERRRISRELHDGVVQEILGVQMLLRNLKYNLDVYESMEIYDQIDKSLTKIQDDLRGLSSKLRPTILDDLGIVSAFRSHFLWVYENHGVKVNFIENIGGLRFYEEAETVFYRICQEALLNACKYSGCNEVKVRLMKGMGYLSLEVTDDGNGFDPDAVEIRGTGLGIPGMAEWAELIDGELTFQAIPGKGVSVCLYAPI